MESRYYITTPIYYVNAPPHLGHAYTTIVADVLNRFHMLTGKETYFLTGTDEHGDKVVEAAAAAGKDPQTYVDQISELFRETWPNLNITNDYFIRTTDELHKGVVRYILQKVYDHGDIYFSSYSGQYCVGCERFYTVKELVDGKCPQHDRPPVAREEENYFFKMSKYQDWLIDHIQKNPTFIRPGRYRNEVLSFLSEPLEDLCISRPKSRLSWGITLPFDDRYVTYVWFDALINYISALSYPDGLLFSHFWPVAQHLIAKDILKPHGIYWPTMLKAAGIPLYRHLNVHGYWNVEEKKMSKSRGTVVKPLNLLTVYGLDGFRYFLMREMVFGLDASFSEEALVSRINADLANDLGNLTSRLLTMVHKYCQGRIPQAETEDEEDSELKEAVEKLPRTYANHMENLQFHKALMVIWEVINHVNRYIDQSAPWVLARDTQKVNRLRTVLYYSLESLKVAGVLLAPIMPDTSEKLLERLGVKTDPLKLRLERDAIWGTLVPETTTRLGKPLFPRIDKAAEDETAADGATRKPLVGMDEFTRLDLQVAEITGAEPIPGSKNLLKLQVDVGEKRVVVAGISRRYLPEDLLGKQVVIVTNLKPAKRMGIISEGMVLVAGEDEEMTLIAPEKRVKPGSPVH